MPPIPVVASDAHRAHDPPYEINNGEVVSPVWEQPARGEVLRDALALAGLPVSVPVAHGLNPVLAVHDRGLVEFLAEAHPAWLAAGGPPAMVPDTFATAR